MTGRGDLEDPDSRGSPAAKVDNSSDDTTVTPVAGDRLSSITLINYLLSFFSLPPCLSDFPGVWSRHEEGSDQGGVGSLVFTRVLGLFWLVSRGRIIVTGTLGSTRRSRAFLSSTLVTLLFERNSTTTWGRWYTPYVGYSGRVRGSHFSRDVSIFVSDSSLFLDQDFSSMPQDLDRYGLRLDVRTC